MIIYVVLEETGGWGGTERYQHIYNAFSNEKQARDYIEQKQKTKSAREDRFSGEVFEVELEENI